MISVKLPTILRQHAGGRPEVQTGGGTLRQVLDALEEQYPGLTGGLRGEDGSLRRHVNVYVNGEDVRYLGALDAPVSDGDTVSILPAVAGGEDRSVSTWSAPRAGPCGTGTGTAGADRPRGR